MDSPNIGPVLDLLVFQACLLLSLESTYPPAHQLSLDMLKVDRKSGFYSERLVVITCL